MSMTTRVVMIKRRCLSFPKSQTRHFSRLTEGLASLVSSTSQTSLALMEQVLSLGISMERQRGTLRAALLLLMRRPKLAGALSLLSPCLPFSILVFLLASRILVRTVTDAEWKGEKGVKFPAQLAINYVRIYQHGDEKITCDPPYAPCLPVTIQLPTILTGTRTFTRTTTSHISRSRGRRTS